MAAAQAAGSVGETRDLRTGTHRGTDGGDYRDVLRFPPLSHGQIPPRSDRPWGADVVRVSGFYPSFATRSSSTSRLEARRPSILAGWMAASAARRTRHSTGALRADTRLPVETERDINDRQGPGWETLRAYHGQMYIQADEVPCTRTARRHWPGQSPSTIVGSRDSWSGLPLLRRDMDTVAVNHRARGPRSSSTPRSTCDPYQGSRVGPGGRQSARGSRARRSYHYGWAGPGRGLRAEREARWWPSRRQAAAAAPAWFPAAGPGSILRPASGWTPGATIKRRVEAPALPVASFSAFIISRNWGCGGSPAPGCSVPQLHPGVALRPRRGPASGLRLRQDPRWRGRALRRRDRWKRRPPTAAQAGGGDATDRCAVPNTSCGC